MRIIPASQPGPEITADEISAEISRVFVEGFYHLLKNLCKDKTRLAKALAHMFKMEDFFVALDGNRVAGFLACTTGLEACVKLDKTQLRKHLGFARGSLAWLAMHKQIDIPHYPFPFEEGMGALENLAVDPAYRGQDIARLLFAHVMDAVPYRSFALEVADNNTAQELYKKIGFREVARIPQKFAAITGTKANLYMIRPADAAVAVK